MVAAWIRERRRRAAAKGRKRGFNRALVALFVVLLSVFFWPLGQVFNAPTPGQKLTLDELSALAANPQISTATFLDEDNRIVGRFVDPDGATSTRYYVDYSQNASVSSDIYKSLQSDGARIVIDTQTGK